jgi:hypothetical protein
MQEACLLKCRRIVTLEQFLQILACRFANCIRVVALITLSHDGEGAWDMTKSIHPFVDAPVEKGARRGQEMLLMEESVNQ